MKPWRVLFGYGILTTAVGSVLHFKGDGNIALVLYTMAIIFFMASSFYESDVN